MTDIARRIVSEVIDSKIVRDLIVAESKQYVGTDLRCQVIDIVARDIDDLLTKFAYVPQATKPKLCIDCKHHAVWSDGSDTCKAGPRKVDLVTGAVRDKFCDIARGDGQECGPEGNLFEQKLANYEDLAM